MIVQLKQPPQRIMPKQESSFIEKLYNAIQEQRSPVVDWDPTGKGFIVGNLGQFTNQILLRKFGIGRLDSFARKLNKHGFKRSKIDKNKIRFFHKYFNRQSKNLNKIKKLTKQQSLPKHIKLKKIREELNKKNSTTISRDSDIVSQIFQGVKIKESQNNTSQVHQVSNEEMEYSDNCEHQIDCKGMQNHQFLKFGTETGEFKTISSIFQKTPSKKKCEDSHNNPIAEYFQECSGLEDY